MFGLLFRLGVAATVTTGLTMSSAMAESQADFEVSAKVLRDAIKAEPGLQLIDVRTPQEFADGHIPGAKNIPLEDIKARAGELKKSRQIWLVCATGTRSDKAAGELESMEGFNTINVKGGTTAWKQLGLDLE